MQNLINSELYYTLLSRLAVGKATIFNKFNASKVLSLVLCTGSAHCSSYAYF